eukprot:6202311-Pleurochrysis_carterae.AAC.2
MCAREREGRRGFSGAQWREAGMTHEHVKCATRRGRFVEYISEYEANCCAHACAVAAETRTAAATLSAEAWATS